MIALWMVNLSIPLELRRNALLSNVYEIALAQLGRAADYLELEPSLRLILSQPKNCLLYTSPSPRDS